MSFTNTEEVFERINANEKPLAFYYFGKKSKGREMIEKSTSGGACINDALIHLACSNIPFGGVGNSGMGSYHGYKSF